MKENKLINWFLNGDVGLSSKNIVGVMCGLKTETYHPLDKWDRKRCIELLKVIPEWIPRLDEMKLVDKEWEKQVEIIKREINQNND